MSHTKGPWIIGPSGDLDTPIFCNGKDAINVYAGEVGQLQAEANARLISSAPEALEIIKFLRDVWVMDETSRELCDAYLAKVRGEA